MKQAILLFTLVLTTFLCFGQKQHLEPAKDFKIYQGELKEYYDNLFPLLYLGYSKDPIARYTSLPSFSSEYAFSVETIGGKNYVLSHSLSENYWYAKNKKKVKLVSNKTELTNELFLKIVELFKVLDQQTKKSKHELLGNDGVTYYFATTDNNGDIKIGKTWTPKESTLLGRLIKICDKIYLLGRGNNVSQADILNDIELILKELK
jgi:hypothetical protein